ncbi:winged helix-turn-helix transcriptional regulator [bacterium]|nr:winged helix-turn-helix transcriptional regulator [bacterium]
MGAERPTTDPVNRMFRAFSDRTRLRILHLLRAGELCVGDLVTALEVPQPTASRHLAYLRSAGLVVVRKEGLWKYYSLAPATSGFHRKLVECLASCFSDVPELRSDTARAEKVKGTAGCCPEEERRPAEQAKPSRPSRVKKR